MIPFLFLKKGSEKLKRVLLKFLLVICLCLVPTVGTYAADSTESSSSDDEQDWYDAAPELDDKGRRIKGTFDCYRERKGDKVDKQDSYKGYFACSEGCAYWLKHDPLSSGDLYWVPYEFVCTTKQPKDAQYRLYEFHLDNKNEELSKSFIKSNFEKFYYDYYGYESKDVESTGHFSSSLPIFKAGDTDAINAYLENGDLSGAENEHDISQPEQDDSVELPKNVRTYGNVFETTLRQASLQGRQVKYNAMTVRWDPPSDINSYSYDVKIQCTYSITSNSNISATGRVPDLTKSETTTAVMIVTDYPYANRGTYDLTTGKEIARGENQPEDCVINEESLKKLTYSCDFENVFPTKLKIWIRNRKGNKCSNWVAVTSNASQVAGSDSKANVEDDSGNKVANDDYDDTPIDNSDKKTYYETDPDSSSAESPKFSLNEFYSYLKSGFGLLGSNGLIAFFAKSFSFIPSHIWSLITAGIAVMIIIGIINFALKR